MGRGIVYGLAGGGVVVTLMALVYSASPPLFLSPIFQWSLILVYLAAMVLTLLKRPPLPRGSAIRAALVCYLCVSACYYVYTYFLYEFFDPELYQLQSELMIENAKAFAGDTPGKLAETPEALYAPEKLQYTLGGIAYNYAFGILSGAAISFLLGSLLGYSDGDDAEA